MSKEHSKKEQLNNAFNFNFLTNSVNGLQSSKKRLKLFQCFQSKLCPKGILFLQETHSSFEKEKKWNDEFNGQSYYSHGKTNSCGVQIAFHGNLNYHIKKKISGDNGRILILDVEIVFMNYLLINLYNGNTETDQLKTLKSLSTLFDKVENISDKDIIFAGDFNVFFNQKLDAAGGNPLVKKLSISKFLEIKERLNLCDIWRVRYPKSKVFAFRQRHYSGFIQRRLDYIFLSNKLQESIKKVEILNALSTDHSPIFCSIFNRNISLRGPGLWKFNNS